MAPAGSCLSLMLASVSVIIPILNEANTLPELLDGLEQQASLPREIIFVDAGSTDGSPQTIEKWWATKVWSEGECRILTRPGAFPGAGRNMGIEAAKSDWIAFLDGGIKPEPNWLDTLLSYAQVHHVSGVFGVCRFCGEGVVGKAVCALSYGQGALSPVLPASLFHRDVFKKVGLFASDLRFYEDTLWVSDCQRAYPVVPVCWDALVTYHHFPNSFLSAFKKWFLSATHAVKAGVQRKQQTVYLIFFSLFCLGLLFKTLAALLALSVYAGIRGCLDPIRRSGSWCWWKGAGLSFGVALMLGIGLDMAKTAGFLWGYIQKVRTWIHANL